MADWQSLDPEAAREAEKYENPIPSRELILQHLGERGSPAARGAGRPGPGQVVGWGHAGAHGRSSGCCWEPRCASARAFAPPIN